jgi:hypothetical protein
VSQAQLPTGRLPRLPVPAVRPIALAESGGPGRPVGGAAGEVRCELCGAPMAEDDIFCGECGHVSRSVSDTFSRPRDTAVIDRITASEIPVRLEAEPVPAAPDPPAEIDSPSVLGEPAPIAPAPDPAPDPAPAPASVPALAPMPARAPADERARFDEREHPSAAERPSSFAGRHEKPSLAESGDLEATRIVRRESGIRFVLQFSTGESFTVYGTGLIGRNPRQEPGEYVDQLVRVLDGSRSVSKTHLEFGQEDGAFWIADRFSGNGTIVREPDSSPARCEPAKRYRVMRGTRVEIGEQFFIVS